VNAHTQRHSKTAEFWPIIDGFWELAVVWCNLNTGKKSFLKALAKLRVGFCWFIGG
jgi:hypothetical protein